MLPFHGPSSRRKRVLRKLGNPRRLRARWKCQRLLTMAIYCLFLYALIVIFVATRMFNYNDVKGEGLSLIDSPSQQQKNLTTLVIMIGNLRGGEATWKTAYKNLLDYNNVDLALVIGKNDNHASSSLYQRAKYLYEFPEFGNDWANAIDLIDGKEWRQSVLPYVTSKWNWSGFMGGVKGIGGSGAIHFMARYFAQELIRQEQLLDSYDRFVITRADHYYHCPHDLSRLDNRFVWVPKQEDYGGICDRHVISSSQNVMKVLDVFPSLIRNPDLYQTAQGKLRNTKPEEFLKLFWEKTGVYTQVRRFDRMMFTLMLDGVDTTRGRTGSQVHIDEKLHEEGLRVKYPNEYYASKCTCSETESKYLPVFWSSHGLCISEGHLLSRFIAGV